MLAASLRNMRGSFALPKQSPGGVLRLKGATDLEKVAGIDLTRNAISSPGECHKLWARAQANQFFTNFNGFLNCIFRWLAYYLQTISRKCRHSPLIAFAHAPRPRLLSPARLLNVALARGV